jgi:hypothetical protein
MKTFKLLKEELAENTIKTNFYGVDLAPLLKGYTTYSHNKNSLGFFRKPVDGKSQNANVVAKFLKANDFRLTKKYNGAPIDGVGAVTYFTFKKDLGFPSEYIIDLTVTTDTMKIFNVSQQIVRDHS